MSETRVAADALRRFISLVLSANGLSEESAATVARLMTTADLIGQDGHGVFRLAQYVRRLKAGGINPAPKFTLLEDYPASAVVDGDNAMGHLVMNHAAELALEKARRCGVAWVGSRNSNHAGPASLYAMKALQEDMIGLYVAVGSANHMPPWGGTDMLLSTNPIAVAIPAAERPPIVLDMATTVAAYGKVKTAVQRGEMMPEGWMIDRQGNPLLDPNKSAEGFLLPIGGPKGYGLSLVFGILAGVLNGAAFGRNVVDFNADSKTRTNTGQFILMLNIAAFTDPAEFRSSIDEVWTEMKSSARLPGVDDIRLPGERLDATRRERTTHGIPVPATLLAVLDDLADENRVARIER
ncbi:Ldh family oxidoreductase [uncultured Roseibium sp.]|uniref:Ldh family oxidoreductase n=1 Tax=uncultured Roseibium sp. TaxID=1936171 RepID=UPI0026288209|nr:Ldh family oxidoreductase [uncultured Roseibium sp.]